MRRSGLLSAPPALLRCAGRFRAHRQAVDAAAGPVEDFGVGELVEHQPVQPLPYSGGLPIVMVRLVAADPAVPA